MALSPSGVGNLDTLSVSIQCWENTNSQSALSLICLGFSGVLGGSLLYITGQTFDVDLSKTLAPWIRNGSVTDPLEWLRQFLSIV